MINVVFKNLLSENRIDLNTHPKVSFEVSGHSGLSAKGSDIVCAAVSTLAQTCILSIDRVLEIEQDIVKKEGFLCSVINVKNLTADVIIKLEFLLETLLIGLVEIEKEYPDRLNIEFFND